ncbi:MAG: hypothetical protein AAGI91_11160 [Bacteroidota bacterium]
MSYLVVTTLDVADTDRARVERELAFLGLRNQVEGDEADLPRNVYAGFFDAPTAHALRRRVADEVQGTIGRFVAGARVLVSVGGHGGLRRAA